MAAQISAESLFAKYRDPLLSIIQSIKDQGMAGLTIITMQIATTIVPPMMADVGAVRTLSGSSKKQMIIDAVGLAIVEGFTQLNKEPQFANSQLDEAVRDLLLKSVSPLIDTFVSIEDGNLVFNKRARSFFSCFPCCKK
jgi:hypothetical protein